MDRTGQGAAFTNRPLRRINRNGRMKDMIIADTGKTLIRPLAMLALAAGLAGAPIAASADTGGSETGRGEAPQRISVDMDTLYGLNDDTLFRLSNRRNVSIQGKMRRFASVRVIRAIQYAPDLTLKLVRRFERADSSSAELRIVENEMDAMRKRHGLAGSFKSFVSGNPREIPTTSC